MTSKIKPGKSFIILYGIRVDETEDEPLKITWFKDKQSWSIYLFPRGSEESSYSLLSLPGSEPLKKPIKFSLTKGLHDLSFSIFNDTWTFENLTHKQKVIHQVSGDHFKDFNQVHICFEDEPDYGQYVIHSVLYESLKQQQSQYSESWKDMVHFTSPEEGPDFDQQVKEENRGTVKTMTVTIGIVSIILVLIGVFAATQFHPAFKPDLKENI